MKRFLYFILGLLLVMVGCNNVDDRMIYEEIDYSLSETRTLNVGEKINLNLDSLLYKYNFSSVKFKYDNEIIKVNYREDIIGIKNGKTQLSVVLGDKVGPIVTLDLGIIYVFDINEFIHIQNPTSLYYEIVAKPNGYFIIDSDLDMSKFPFMKTIPHFSGVIINPSNYVIKNLNISNNDGAALFYEVSNAFIDNLIIEDVNIEGILRTYLNQPTYPGTAALAVYVENSHIRNVKVTGKVMNGYFIGGLISYMKDSILKNSSFEGEVGNGVFVGGLIGFMANGFSMNNYNRNGIFNCYVYAKITGGYTLSNFKYLGGFVGQIEGGVISNNYFTGSTELDQYDHFSSIGHAYRIFYKLINVYYTVKSLNIYNVDYIKDTKVYYISEEDLKNGSSLIGLENFIYKDGDFPRLR